MAGQWLPQGGQFVVTPTVGGVGVLTADPNNALPIGEALKTTCLGDSFTVKATMTRVYPDDRNASTFPGTNIFLKSSVFSDTTDTGYLFGYSYQTDTAPPLLPGVVSVFRCDGINTCTELCSQVATTGSPFTVNLTAPNTLKVIAIASAFQFYINGTQVCRGISDAKYPTGALVIDTLFLQAAGNSFSISNVSVQAPAPAAPREEADERIYPAGGLTGAHTTSGISVEHTPSGVVYVTRH